METKFELYCGDCLDVLPTLKPDSVDAVITDPPYFVSESTITIKEGIRKLNALRWKDDFLWIPFVESALRPGGSIYAFTGDDEISHMKAAIRETETLRVFSRLHWVKSNPMPSFTKRTYRGGVELALFIIKDGEKNYFSPESQNDMLSVWFYPVVSGNERTEHPTQKPVELISEWILDSTKPGDLVADPFMGSGTTGVACARLGRSFIGIEKDPNYFAIAEKRINAARSQMILPLDV